MSAPAKSRFFGPLSLGGKLSLVNANFWLILFLLQRGGAFSLAVPEPVASYIALAIGLLIVFFSLPFATCVLLPTVGTPPAPNIVEILASVSLLIFNSFVCGYGLAWLSTKLSNYFRQRRKSTSPPSDS